MEVLWGFFHKLTENRRVVALKTSAVKKPQFTCFFDSTFFIYIYIEVLKDTMKAFDDFKNKQKS